MRIARFVAATAALALPSLAAAETLAVPAEDGALARALARAEPGDTLRLEAGEHAGPIVVTTPLVLDGAEGAVLRGDGAGVVVSIEATDVTVRGLTITGSGLSLATMDAGVTVRATADRARVAGNHLRDNLIGVHLEGPEDALVEGNLIEGRRDLRMNERGNGVHVWNTPGSVVRGNVFRYGRDGIFVNTSRENVFADNRFERLRFAIHYMYTNRSTVRGNLSVGNDIGYALMYSQHLLVEDNVSRDDRDHGVMFNYANNSTVRRNYVHGDTEKCVFLYNSNKNAIEGNWFEGCDIGVHYTAGSARNRIDGNAFIDNRTQVKYVGSRDLDWGENGRGNYWSDHTAFDLDGDGIADTVYRPNDLVDQLMWREPLAKLLVNSPVVQLLRWAQSEFPALLPGGVVDTAPLMQPTPPPAAAAPELAR